MAADVAERRVRVSRKVRIDESVLSSALLRLRRDQPAPFARWTLGDRGSFEIDAWFDTAGAISGSALRATGWLLGPQGDMVRIDIVAAPGHECSMLSIETLAPLPSLWEREPACLRDLARTALAELDEELRWQASRTVAATA